METVSVTCVRRTPRFSSSCMAAICGGVAGEKTRTVRSAAISVRASRTSMLRKARLKLRTPVRAPTPTATARMTNRNLAGEERDSRQAILNAVRQGNRSAMNLHLVGDNQAVAQKDAPVRALG